MSFLSLIPLKAWLIAGGVAAFGFVLWHDHWMSGKYKAAHAEVVQVKANMAALESARAHELKIAEDASNAYQKDLADLRKSRSDSPILGVMCKRPKPVPTATTAAAGSNDARPADDTGSNEEDRDIGPLLDDFATACEANLSQLTRLQDWIRSR